MPANSVVRILARAFLAGEQSVGQIVSRAEYTLGRSWRWLRPLVRRYVEATAGEIRPRHRDVVAFLSRDQGFQAAWAKYSDKLSIKHWPIEPQRMQPVAAARNWDVPVIETVGELAEWLHLGLDDLYWFADRKRLGYKQDQPRLRHYHYRVLAKQFGEIRLIEAPKSRLKELQRQILREILEKIPAHSAAHGFVKSRSIKTFVAPHVSQRVVLKMDLRDFFPSLLFARIQALFRTAGYPEPVAEMLGCLCTNPVPRDVWGKPKFGIDPLRLQEAQILYKSRHVPQGAPTSPALANICSYRLDCRLAGLAKSAGAEYTRYADDLAFSGDEAFESRVERFSIHVAAILAEEGFTVHYRKTRVMREGVRQYLAGIVTNRHPNITRTDFDRLKAILTNCVRFGWENQNRDGHPNFRLHLEGRVHFVETINPQKGNRLRAILEQVRW